MTTTDILRSLESAFETRARRVQPAEQTQGEVRAYQLGAMDAYSHAAAMLRLALWVTTSAESTAPPPWLSADSGLFSLSEVRNVAQRRHIHAIKDFRIRTAVDLRDAKHAIDKLRNAIFENLE